MEYPIAISMLNDFIFCPISIYFHEQYKEINTKLFQAEAQQKGTFVHQKIDEGEYSTSKHILQAREVYCEQYGLFGKIDTYDIKRGVLTERKRLIKTIYDGYVFQLYGQYFALKEMGYDVRQLRLYSYDDNKAYEVKLPEQDNEMFAKFQKLLCDFRSFDPAIFLPTNPDKCANCIYYDICDRGL